MIECGAEEMAQLIAALQEGAGGELALAEHLIAAYPDDARLHFMRGSLLAGSGRPIEAHAALSRAVALAPDFTLARFQLGFFELTSGEAARALETWGPLRALPTDHYLARFVAGLTDLIHDRFAEAIAALQDGIAVNTENPLLNHDMQLIIDQCAGVVPDRAPAASAESSATSFLLGQIEPRGTTH